MLGVVGYEMGVDAVRRLGKRGKERKNKYRGGGGLLFFQKKKKNRGLMLIGCWKG